MKKRTALTTIISLLACIASTGHAEGAQHNAVPFKHITMQNGLSNNKVNHIYRDSQGFVWFSTSWGLNRYDGYSMRVFLSSPTDSLSLGQNDVTWVADIANDKMLVRTLHQLWVMDKRNETFHHADSLLATLMSMPENNIKAFVDRNYNIWCADNGNLTVVSSDGWKSLFSSVGSGVRISGFAATGENVFVIREDGTVDTYAHLAGSGFTRQRTEETPAGDGRHKIFVDKSGGWWIYTEDKTGIWHRAAQENEWERLSDSPESRIAIPSHQIRDVMEDKDGRIWITSDHGGINILDNKSRSVLTIRHDKNDPRSLASNSASCIATDSEGCVWVGDVTLGASLYAEPIFKFNTDNLSIDSIDRDFVAQVNSMTEDKDGNIWYGTDDRGLLRISADGKSRTLFRAKASDPNALTSDVIVSLSADKRGGVWVGTFMGGLCYYDGSRFVRYRGRKDVPKSASSDNIWAVSCDDDGNVWIGSLGHGVSKLDAKGSWTEWNFSNDGLTSDYVQCVEPLGNGKACVGTAEGVCIINSTENHILQISSDMRLHATKINDVFYDNRHIIWVCASNGLYAISSASGSTLAHIDHTSGLPTDAVLGATEDKDHNVWVSTPAGIICVNVAKTPKSEREGLKLTTFTYGDQDGFVSGNINERSILCTKEGEIIVGRAGGVNRFFPNNIHYHSARPEVIFTSLSAFGSEVQVGQQVGGSVLLPAAMPFLKSIELPHSVNMFSIGFSTMTNVLPEKVRYSYTLTGFNSSWLNTSEPEATYTNLSPGDYTLVVKALNCDGVECQSPAMLRIRILPPWWRTAWAYCIYVLLGVGAIFAALYMVRRRERMRFQIQQISDEAERQKQMDDMKLRFFTNISHELRTPLTLIVSPLENILESAPADSPLRPQLELMHRNSQRLLNMVNQLLDFRKTDLGQMSAVMSEGDLVSFVTVHCQQFVKLSNRNIEFDLKACAESIYMKFDKDKMGKIVSNLLSNAYKFTPDGGSIGVSIDLNASNDRVTVTVADTGIGIADEHKRHIFDRFYQVPQADSSVAGSGIGLHLVREFVELQGGTVSVSDNPIGQGTIFSFTLPVETATVVTHKEEAEDELTEVAEPEEEMANAKPKILVVDDNDDFLTLLTATLEDTYNVVCAQNGATAFTRATDEQPDLIISDVMMPIMDGNELCSKIKSDIRTSHIPVFLLTAKTAEEHAIEGLENGADDYLTKPFNPKILRMKVQKILELIQHRQKHVTKIDPTPSKIAVTPIDEQFIRKAVEYVEQHISSPELSVEDLSRHLNMSRVHLYKKLMSLTGRPPIEFIRIIRLKRAAQLLQDPAQNVSDAAYAVGFNNPKYFSKYFKDEFGILPSKFAGSPQAQKMQENGQ